MKNKYNILTRNKKSALFWCQSSKFLFLVSTAFLCLLCVLLFGIDCVSSVDQNYFCSIFFNKGTTSFESLAYEIESSPNTGIFARSEASSAVDKNIISSNNNELQKRTLANVFELKRRIYTENKKQTIRNEDKFGPIITNDTIVIVVQIHTKLQYLQVLLESLEGAKYIEDMLLVFSHGFYSEEINNAVQSIQFARVLQTFYPYGWQTHQNTFPGFSSNDCPPGVTQGKVEKSRCRGQPRNVESLQEKHRWWWTVNMVFNGLRITKTFNGLVLFLEEDHYVFPDFLHVLRLMRNSTQNCPGCNLLGLGFIPEYTTVEGYRSRADKLHVVQWNNMGYAFDRQFWSGLNSQRCSDMFCEYNDYNWDFTLAYLSHKCLPHELKTLNVVSPRVFRIGECYKHFQSKNCSSQKSLQLIHSLQQDVSQFLFPPVLTVSSTYSRQPHIDRRIGGWDDPRDIQLCKNMSQLHRSFSNI